MALPAVIGIAVAAGIKGRWLYHLVHNKWSVREANRASGEDIDKLHDVGDEFIAVCRAIFRLEKRSAAG